MSEMDADARCTGGVPPRRRDILLACAAGAHLILVSIFIWTGAPRRQEGAFANALRTYRNLTGIFRDYTFFAPEVAKDTKAAFAVERVDGTTTVVNFSSDNREIDFRCNCIVASCLRETEATHIFAQSWAASILGSDPAAEQVTVMAMALSVPGMAAYRAGARPVWEPAFAATFARRDEGLTPSQGSVELTSPREQRDAAPREPAGGASQGPSSGNPLPDPPANPAAAPVQGAPDERNR